MLKRLTKNKIPGIDRKWIGEYASGHNEIPYRGWMYDILAEEIFHNLNGYRIYESIKTDLGIKAVRRKED